MSINRWNARRDKNEAAIVQALERLGVLVQRLSEKGFADLATYHPRFGVQLLEVKTQTGTLTAAQQVTHASWPIVEVRSISEALALFGIREG